MLDSFRNFLKYNSFNLSHDVQFTCDMGALCPILCKEVLPGDVWRGNANVFLRLIPQLAPFMHVVKCKVHWFFVPNRLTQKDWEKFITKGFSGTDVVAFPYVTAPSGGFGKYSSADYMGLPVDVAGITVDAKPFRGLALIHNEWYKNENVQTYTTIDDGNGADTTTPTSLYYVNWQKDYFTGAYPFAQRGNPIYLPFGVEAPVVGNGKALGLIGFNGDTSDPSNFVMTAGGPDNYQKVSLGWSLNSQSGTRPEASGSAAAGREVVTSSYQVGVSTSAIRSNMVADLRSATGVTINEVRIADRVQRWMEANARNGVRYIEFLLGHFGVKSSDARLDRPEYLGGGSSVIATSEVLQTSSTDSTSPQGNMAGHSFSVMKSGYFERRFEEHGYIFCLLSITPRTKYQDGIERQWKRETPLEYYFPEFADTGMQPIYGYEICATGNSTYDNGIFAFKDPYDEYRRSYSRVAADFRDTLDYWTMTRKMDKNNPPQYNDAFVKANDVTKRIFSVTNAKPCIVSTVFNLEVLRKMPKKGIPGML